MLRVITANRSDRRRVFAASWYCNLWWLAEPTFQQKHILYIYIHIHSYHIMSHILLYILSNHMVSYHITYHITYHNTCIYIYNVISHVIIHMYIHISCLNCVYHRTPPRPLICDPLQGETYMHTTWRHACTYPKLWKRHVDKLLASGGTIFSNKPTLQTILFSEPR